MALAWNVSLVGVCLLVAKPAIPNCSCLPVFLTQWLSRALCFLPAALKLIVDLLSSAWAQKSPISPELGIPVQLHSGQHSTYTCTGLFHLKAYQVKAGAMWGHLNYTHPETCLQRASRAPTLEISSCSAILKTTATQIERETCAFLLPFIWLPPLLPGNSRALLGQKKIFQSTNLSEPRGEESSWLEASFSTRREGSCSVLKSVAACPRVKVDLMLHKWTVSCLSLLHSTLKQCCLCAWSSNRKESSLPGKGHSRHGWEQADLAAFWEVTLPLVLCGVITRVLGHSCIPVGCSLSVWAKKVTKGPGWTRGHLDKTTLTLSTISATLAPARHCSHAPWSAIISQCQSSVCWYQSLVSSRCTGSICGVNESVQNKIGFSSSFLI